MAQKKDTSQLGVYCKKYRRDGHGSSQMLLTHLDRNNSTQWLGFGGVHDDINQTEGVLVPIFSTGSQAPITTTTILKSRSSRS